MANTTLKVRVKQKYDTEANWIENDPVLLAGEVAHSSDKQMYKVGDGTSKWSALAYNKANSANSATLLANARTIRTNLASTSTASFNGSANITPGVTGTLPVGNGGTGKTSEYAAANAFINSLPEGTSTPVDNDYYVAQYVNGGTETTTYNRRKTSSLWEYMKGKISSVLGLTSTSYGGNATTATALTTSAGSATQPVYFSSGKPVATTYTLGKSVPSNAVFTDTHYTSKNVVGATTATANTTTALTNGNVYLNNVENGTVRSTHKISGSGAASVTTDTSGNIIVSSTNTTYSAGTGMSLSGTTFNHKNSITAGTAQGDANKTLTFGGTFTIPTVSYDAQGHVTGKGTTTMTMPANPNVDTKVTSSTNNPSSATTYYPTFVTGSTTGGISYNNGLQYYTAEGTTSAVGVAQIGVGNNIASGTAGNKQGKIYMYGTSTGYTTIVPGYNSTSSITLTLPSSTGIIALTSSSITGKSAGWSTARTLSWTGDATGSMSVDGTANKSATLTLAASGVTAGNYGPSANASPGHSGTFSVPYISVDAKGRVISASTKTITMPATPSEVTNAVKLKTARTLTIGNTGKSFDGSANVSWSLSEIGAAAASHPHSYLPLSGGTLTGVVNDSFVTNTYLEGNQGKALINSTCGAGKYTMLYKYPSTNGYFTMGGFEGKFLLQYTAKTTVDAATNSVTKSVTLLDEGGSVSFPGTVTASTFSGALSGNSSSATKLATARTINGTSFNGTANITTANWGTARTITIGSTGKSVNGSANVSWSLSEIGAASSTHTHNYAGSSSAGGAANSANVANRLALIGGRPASADLDLKNTTTNGMQLMIATSSMTTHKPRSDGYIQTFSWDTNAGYGSQIYIGSSDPTMQVRGCNQGTWDTSWRTILDSSNYTSYAPTKTGSGASGTWGISVSGNAATATKLGTATVGSGTKPIYLNAGTATAFSTTVGSATKPIYMNSGTITACSTTVGSSSRPMYSNAGTLTAVTSVAVAYGGTGATTAAGAITNLGAMDLTSAQTASGIKTFSNGIKIGSATMKYDSTTKAIVISV